MPAASTAKAATTPRKAAAPKAKPALREAAATAPAHGRVDAALKELGERAESFANTTIGELKTRVGPYVDDVKSHAGPMLNDLKTRAAPVVDDLAARAQPYTDQAGQRLASAERVIAEKVKQNPITAMFAFLGVGVLLGLILGGGRSR